MVGAGVLGGFKVRGINGQYKDVEFSIGSGFDGEERNRLWTGREALIGNIVKYKFFDKGSDTRPRFPTFEGFRNAEDMD